MNRTSHEREREDNRPNLSFGINEDKDFAGQEQDYTFMFCDLKG
jgi:hypothetical protein